MSFVNLHFVIVIVVGGFFLLLPHSSLGVQCYSCFFDSTFENGTSWGVVEQKESDEQCKSSTVGQVPSSLLINCNSTSEICLKVFKTRGLEFMIHRECKVNKGSLGCAYLPVSSTDEGVEETQQCACDQDKCNDDRDGNKWVTPSTTPPPIKLNETTSSNIVRLKAVPGLTLASLTFITHFVKVP